MGQFKASLVETESQFLHVSRYIHLNPYSAGLVSNFDDLLSYEWSSLPEFLSQRKDIAICNKERVLNSFLSVGKYKKFIFDQKDYQKKLKLLQYLVSEPIPR